MNSQDAKSDDWNEIQKLKARLQTSEASLNEILKFSRDVSYKIDLTTNSYAYLSYSIEGILGWSRQLYLDQGRDFTKKIIHPEDLPRMELIIPSNQKIFENDLTTQEIEFRMKDKNDNYHWFLDRFTVISEILHPKFIIGTLVDITARKLTESALSESEEKFRNLINQAPFDIQIYDLKGVLQQVNNYDFILWGTKPEDVIGKYNVLKDEQLSEFTEIRKAFQGEFSDPFELFYDPKKSGISGEPKWLRTNVFPLKNDQNQISSIVVFHTDISEQKQNLIKLKENEEKYNSLFHKSRDAIILNNISGEIIEANQSAQDLFGYSEEEFKLFNTDDLHPTDKIT